MPIPSATTQTCSPKWTPSSINVTRSSSASGLASKSVSAVSVALTNRRLTADLLVADAARSTCSPTGSSPARQPRVEIPASIFCMASRPSTSVAVNSSYDGTGNSPEPSFARIRGRSTGTRRPPRVTEPFSVPCRTADRFGSCLPFGPHAAATSASIIAAITCSPVPTAIASRPSRTSATISPSATVTASGTASAVAAASIVW